MCPSRWTQPGNILEAKFAASLSFPVSPSRNSSKGTKMAEPTPADSESGLPGECDASQNSGGLQLTANATDAPPTTTKKRDGAMPSHVRGKRGALSAFASIPIDVLPNARPGPPLVDGRSSHFPLSNRSSKASIEKLWMPLRSPPRFSVLHFCPLPPTPSGSAPRRTRECRL